LNNRTDRSGVAPTLDLQLEAKPLEPQAPRLLDELAELTDWHAQRCPEYKRILDVFYPKQLSYQSVADVPFLPVRLFKVLGMVSVPPDQIVKTLTSSGTSSQTPSRVFLDRPTALAQTKALISIVKEFLGPKRLPMAIVDHPGVLHDRSAFSARGAGILGFSQLGRDPIYLLDQDMRLNWSALECFLDVNAAKQVFIFGFTVMVWRYLYQACREAGRTIDFGDSVLIHGGGWKKLAAESVSTEKFKQALAEQLGIRRVHNYYGMVEQTGSIFMECERGFFHPSRYSDVLVRDPDTLELLPSGVSGLLQLFSNIPRSYPGHSLLTEDTGTIVGEADCECGRPGKYFIVEGRLPQAELRGCSDTHQEPATWNF
jgi:hypothetical protein